MTILLSAATGLEMQSLLERLTPYKQGQLLPHYEYSGHKIVTCETGVGSLHTTYAICEAIRLHKPDIVINIGIAGSYHEATDIGNCYVIKSEVQADLGVAEVDGFKSPFDLGLSDPDLFPYKNGIINIPINYYIELREAKGLTLNQMTHNIQAAKVLKQRHQADLESMEGAAVAYSCLMSQTPLIMIKSISNVAGVRDKNQWNIELAIENLGAQVFRLLNNLEKEKIRLL